MARHWFITGASGGLGRHLVALALAEGDEVVATVRRPNTLSELSKTYGERLIVEPLDVTDREQVNRVIARCLARGTDRHRRQQCRPRPDRCDGGDD